MDAQDDATVAAKLLRLREDSIIVARELVDGAPFISMSCNPDILDGTTEAPSLR